MDGKSTWTFANEGDRSLGLRPVPPNGLQQHGGCQVSSQHGASSKSAELGAWTPPAHQLDKAAFTATCANAFCTTGRADKMASTLSGNLYHLGGMFEEHAALQAENAKLLAENDALRRTLRDGSLPQEVKDGFDAAVQNVDFSETVALRSRLEALRQEREIFFGVLELSEDLQDASSSWWDSPDKLKSLPDKLRQALLGILELSDNLHEVRSREASLESENARLRQEVDTIHHDLESLVAEHRECQPIIQEAAVLRVENESLRQQNAENKQLQQEVARLRQENESLRQQHVSIQNSEQNHNVEIEELKAWNEQLSRQLEKAGEDCPRCLQLQTELGAARERCDKFGRVGKEIADVKKANAALQKENGRLSAQLQKAQALDEVKDKALQEMRDAHSRVAEELRTAQQRPSSLCQVQDMPAAQGRGASPLADAQQPPSGLAELVELRIAQARVGSASQQRAAEISVAMLQGSSDVLSQCPDHQRKELVASLLKTNAGGSPAPCTPAVEATRAPWAAPWSPVAAPASPFASPCKNMGVDAASPHTGVSPASMRATPTPQLAREVTLAPQDGFAAGGDDHYRSLVANMLMNLVKPSASTPVPAVQAAGKLGGGSPHPRASSLEPAPMKSSPSLSTSPKKPSKKIASFAADVPLKPSPKEAAQVSAPHSNLPLVRKVASQPSLVASPPHPPGSSGKSRAINDVSCVEETKVHDMLRGLARAMDGRKVSPPPPVGARKAPALDPSVRLRCPRSCSQ